MRALQYRTYGGPEVLEVGEAPEPHAGPGQIRIAVRGASLNPIDRRGYRGAGAEGPLTGAGRLGWDAAGVVDEVGEGVEGVAAGDEVFGKGSETIAEYAVLDAWAPKPPSVDWAVVAAAGVVGETGERGLRLLGVSSGQTVFVDGGSGGVGAVAVQMAMGRGARVIASAGESNQDYVRGLGAIPVVHGEGVADRVRAAVGGEHVDAVLDVAGRTPVEELVGLVREPTQLLSIANPAAVDAGGRVSFGGADARAMPALREVADQLGRGTLRIEVRTFPLEEATEAYRVSESGHGRGKLVVVP
jgi:NADPH:quinone reductase-like Zn-dependent oxidoreductase